MEINKYIDYTNLKPDAPESDIIKLCETAKDNNYCSVCINPYFIKLASGLLKSTDTKVCTVIGFPLGQNETAIKVVEAELAIEQGADELDLVINLSALKAKDFDYCLNEINQIKKVAGSRIVKVIFETAYLDKQQKIDAANILLESDADYIKTSTGFASSGANLEDVKLWFDILGHKKKIKAAGGIRTPEAAIEFINAGASRIGASSKL